MSALDRGSPNPPEFADLFETPPIGDRIWSVAWSPTGAHLAWGGAEKDRAIRVLALGDAGGNSSTPADALPSAQPLTLRGHRNIVSSLAWSPDGRRLASASRDHQLRIWTLPADGETMPGGGAANVVLQGHSAGVFSAAWSPDGTRLASGSDDRTIRLWNPETGMAQGAAIRTHGQVWSVGWIDGDTLFAGCADKRILLLAAADGRVLHEHRISASVWSVCALDAHRIVAAAENGCIVLWHPAAPAADEPSTIARLSKKVTTLSLSHDRQLLAAYCLDGTVRLWRTTDWQLVGVIRGRPGAYDSAALAFHPGASIIATLGESTRTLVAWTIASSLLSDPRCSVRMADGAVCGRRQFPSRLDREPRCVLHARSGGHAGGHADAFRAELEALLQERAAPDAGPPAPIDCTGMVFPKGLRIEGRTFERPMRFDAATLGPDVSFARCVFTQPVSIGQGARLDGVSFAGCTFAELDLQGVTLENDADFTGLRCGTFTMREIAAARSGHLRFGGSHFHGPVTVSVLSGGVVDWSGSKFAGGALFNRLDCRMLNLSQCLFADALWVTSSMITAGEVKDHLFDADLDLSHAQFAKGQEVRLRLINKRARGLRLRAVNCDLEQARIEDVRWYRQSHRLTLQDELDLARKTPDAGSSAELVATVYRRLVSNFDRARAYDLAEDCFCAALEITRTDRTRSRMHRWALTLYRAASLYGSSYERALLWLMLLVGLLFPAGYALLPRAAPPAPVAGGGAAADAAIAEPAAAPSAGIRALDGLIVSLEVATFQRTSSLVTPTAPERLLRVLETMTVTAQGALLLLALKRRFAR